MTNSKQDQLTKFEFVLSLEGHIICQRFFNVKDHNPKAMNSLDIYKYIQEICGEISDDLKIKTSDYLCQNQNYFLVSDTSDDETKNVKENFLLELKLGEHVFNSRIFPAHYYHPKVRYAVDIRPKLKKILMDLTEILSSKELETTYLDYEL